MDKIKSRPDAPMLQTMLLRSMQQAVYSPDNIGHFGLAYEAYAHFTSPIRRYPDLLVHRAIKAILAHTKYQPAFAPGTEFNTAISPKARRLQAKDAEQKAELTAARARRNEAVWDELGLHCSANERRADEASRDVEAWLKCYFMRDKLGSDYAGTVSSVTSFGIFVQLDELYVEGLVHVTELGSDYFQYDEARNELRGERTGIRYRLTDRVRVQVSRVDLDARKIDFRLVQEPSAKTCVPVPARVSRRACGCACGAGAQEGPATGGLARRDLQAGGIVRRDAGPRDRGAAGVRSRDHAAAAAHQDRRQAGQACRQAQARPSGQVAQAGFEDARGQDGWQDLASAAQALDLSRPGADMSVSGARRAARECLMACRAGRVQSRHG